MISALHPSSFHLLLQQRSQRLPDRFCDHFLTGFGRMNRVRLIEIAISADVLEQKWNQRRVILLRDVGENALKFRLIIRAEIRRHLHSGDDDFELRIFRFRLVDDRLQICFPAALPRNPRKPSFAPSAMDENIDLLLQQPVDPAQTARARVAAHARR